jgi:hypothetical protein
MAGAKWILVVAIMAVAAPSTVADALACTGIVTLAAATAVAPMGGPSEVGLLASGTF